jgi:hypothetical protein
MKLKVLTHTFFVPLLWIVVLLIQDIAPNLSITQYLTTSIFIGLAIGSILNQLFQERRYLNSFLVDGSIIRLTYLTPFAQKHHLTIRQDTITKIKLTKKIFPLRSFTSLKFHSKDNQIEFRVLSEEVKQAVEQMVNLYPEKLLDRSS